MSDARPRRRPLTTQVGLWMMAQTRQGRAVPPQVVMLLLALATRADRATGRARPGYQLLQRDLGWSEDSIARAVRQAEHLGALVRYGSPHRGRAFEFQLATAVLDAPNLDEFAREDRARKAPQDCGPFHPEKAPQDCGPIECDSPATLRTIPERKVRNSTPERSANPPEKAPQICGAYQNGGTRTEEPGRSTWADAIARMREEGALNERSWAHWFRTTRELRQEGDVLVVAVPDVQWTRHLPYAYGSKLAKVLPPNVTVRFEVNREHALGGAA